VTVHSVAAAQCVSNHFGGEEKVVVVYNDQISWLVDLCYFAGEKLVGLDVVGP
jgi:hypothetical protein